KVSAHLQYEFQLLHCLVVLAGVVVMKAEIRVDWHRERVALACQLNFAESLRGPTGGEQIYAVPLVCCSGARVDRGCAPKARLHAGPVPLEIEFNKAERSVRLGERGVQL